MSARRFWVSGRVQGVFFRESTRQQAQILGITGYARNLDDGRVEVLACGASKALASLEQWLASGPRWARVDRVVAEPADDPLPDSFRIG